MTENNPVVNNTRLGRFNFFKRPKNYQLILGVVVIILIIISFFGGLITGLNRQISTLSSGQNSQNGGEVLNADTLPDYLTKDVNFKLFWKVWDIIREKFIDHDKITNGQLFYGALAGVVASLNDPYSVFMPPAEAEKFTQELAGKFEGIGAEIGIKDDKLTIISPLPESPAEKAGIRALDVVAAIDSLDTTGISLDKAVNLIRGEKGTPVTLKIYRAGEKELLDITIIRDQIQVKSVRSEIKNNDIAYIKITNFNTDTIDGFRKNITDLLAKSPKSIILDLRNNPGGYLNTAVDIAGYWVDSGQLVVKEEFSNEALNQEHLSYGQAQLKNIPTVVLVNEASASASEILAGALQDYGLAKVVGKKTFGKGSVQELEKLSDGSSVKITIARWLTPQGRSIDKNGIEPDIEVELTKDDYNQSKDPQMEKAIELVKPQ